MPRRKTVAENAPPARQPDGFQEALSRALRALTQKAADCRRTGDHAGAMSHIIATTRTLFQQSAERVMSVASPALNREAAHLADNMLAGAAYADSGPADEAGHGVLGPAHGGRGRVLLLVTRLLDTGGHSILVEDIVSRFAGRMDIGLMLTDLARNQSALTREAFDPSRLHVRHLDSATHMEKLRAGWDHVRSFAPDVIIDFSHPFDMVSFALLHGAPARRKLHVWHADHSFALRPVDPVTGLVAVTAYGAVCARQYARRTGQPVIGLPMTCADPYADAPEAAIGTGMRTGDGFLTATCGGIGKFRNRGAAMSISSPPASARAAVSISISARCRMI